MKRREALRRGLSGVCLAAAAGCLGGDRGGSSDTQPTTPTQPRSTDPQPTTDSRTPTGTINGEVLGVVEVGDVDPTPSFYPGTVDLSLLRDVITPDRTAIVELSHTNVDTEPHTFEFGFRPPFSTIYSANDEHRMVLDGVRGGPEKTGRCWTRSGNGELVAPDIAKQVTVAPDESVSTRLGAWIEQPAQGTCFPRKEYPFSSNEYGYEGHTPAGFRFSLIVKPE